MNLIAKYKIVISIVLFILISLVITTLLFYPIFTQPKNQIINEIDNGVKLSGDTKTKMKEGLSFYSKNGLSSEIVMSKFDLFHPIYAFVYTLSEKSTYVQVIHLDRTGVLNFDIKDYVLVEVKKPFQEAVTLAQKYDLSKENPDPANITVYKQPNTEEIQAQKKVRELGENPDYIKDYKACEEKFPPATEEEYNCKLDVEKKYKAN